MSISLTSESLNQKNKKADKVKRSKNQIKQRNNMNKLFDLNHRNNFNYKLNLNLTRQILDLQARIKHLESITIPRLRTEVIYKIVIIIKNDIVDNNENVRSIPQNISVKIAKKANKMNRLKLNHLVILNFKKKKGKLTSRI